MNVSWVSLVTAVLLSVEQANATADDVYSIHD